MPFITEQEYQQQKTGFIPETTKTQEPQRRFGEGITGRITGVGRFLGMQPLGETLGQKAFEILEKTPFRSGARLEELREKGELTPEQYQEIIGTKYTGKQVLGSAIQTGLLAAPISALGIAGKIPGVSKIARFATKIPVAGPITKGIFGGAIRGPTAAFTGGQAFGGALREEEGFGEAAKRGAITAVATGAGGLILGKTLGYIGSRFPKLLGIITAESDEAIRGALENPKAADLGIQKGDEALRTAVKEGGEKSIQLREGFMRGHQQAFSELGKQNTGKLIGKKVLQKGFYDILKEQNVKIGKGDVLDFSISKIRANPGEISKIEAVNNALQQWDDFSLGGINRFKQFVGVMTKFADEAGKSSKSPSLGRYYNFTDTTIKNNLSPLVRESYTEMNKNYSENIDLFDDMVNAFNRGDPFTRLAGIFGKNRDKLRQVIKFYEEKSGQSILPIEAGRELAMEKTAAFGFLNPRSWIDFFWSPGAQAKFVTQSGKTIAGTKIFAGKVGEVLKTPPSRIFRSLIK